EPKTTSAGTDWVAVVDAETGVPVTGMAAWQTRYDVSAGWSNFKLKTKVQAFVEGGANFLSAIGIPLKLGVSIVAVLVACFAATTLDTATRLQRYVIQELATTLRVTPLANKYVATGVAVGLGGALAMMPGPNSGPGSGGLILWPLFGAVNQLLAGLAFMVTVFYLWRRKKPMMFALIPMVIMLILPAWAMLWQMFNTESGWWWKGQMLLFSFGAIVMTLQVWMVIEAVLMFPRVKGVLEESLPPLPAKPKPALASVGSDVRSC
ncbi:MAG: carbon starvation CstA 5TM domain-containing protein, partial [Pirellulaceae bacterium]|nr:carbon starvation CstA 5TM domain-containing protein [Pirellulaceae bacterium]